MANESIFQEHNLDLLGLTGGIFACITTGLILFCEAFVSGAWTILPAEKKSSYDMYVGLWHKFWHLTTSESHQIWFIACQVLFSGALVGLVVSFILAVIYLSSNRASKSHTLVALAFFLILTTLMVLVGLIVFGSHKDPKHYLSWSYGLSGAAVIFLFLGVVLTFLQIKRSNIKIF